MPRRTLKFRPGAETCTVNCFAFYVNKGGKPSCAALQDIYCLKEDVPCTFKAAPAVAAAARARSVRRLSLMGHR